MIPVFHWNDDSDKRQESFILSLSFKTAQFQCFIGKMIPATFRNSSTFFGP